MMIAKNEEHGRHTHTFWEFAWYDVFGPLIGFGYRPWNAFVASLFMIALGCLLFWIGKQFKIVTPTKVDAYNNHDKKIVSELYPKFNAFIYSLETFVPLVKLGVSDYWTPNSNCGAELRCLRKRLLPLFKRAWVERYRTACAESPVKSPAPRNIISKGVRFLRRSFLFFIPQLGATKVRRPSPLLSLGSHGRGLGINNALGHWLDGSVEDVTRRAG